MSLTHVYLSHRACGVLLSALVILVLMGVNGVMMKIVGKSLLIYTTDEMPKWLHLFWAIFRCLKKFMCLSLW